MDAAVDLAYDYPVLGAFWTVMWIFLWVMWLILLFRVVVDVFRDHEMSGWVKAAWLLFLFLIPFLGVLVYVIARGKDMGRREIKHAQEQQEAFNAYIRETAGSATPAKAGADDLFRLSELKAKGELSEEEFQRAKQKLLA
ncbi:MULTISPECIES: SHOCT domain-containing protein [Streptomyces]|uniref:SHOCT domain-containing protein n=1 Tax=Streptomyces TaxID=1883 RepID=UPI000F7B2457|nr:MULTISPECIES: SHOCT domain-containing protein [Streptomyces]RST06486.1 SHOCT domain-containing protein [Streptomyces sp. WAC07149]GLX16844.1 membrane protein [Streptomyces lavendulae subsp. lavendulae]GLX25467.1 membrane protein [Streptomyces lavendulae subsp. lavendulae]